MKRILILSLTLLTLNSCKDEFEPATFQTASIDNNYEADISVTYDKAKESDELGKRINFKIEEAIIAGLNSPEKKTNLEAILEGFNTEYIRFKKEFSDDLEPKWELHVETEKTYQSQDVITFAISIYEFKGGAHGNDKINFLNLNAKTGFVLSQNELLTDLNSFKTLAEEHFKNSLETNENELTMENYFFGKPFQLPENIGYSDDGLILLYNAYEIASYNQGFTEFVIPFEDAAPYLNFN